MSMKRRMVSVMAIFVFMLLALMFLQSACGEERTYSVETPHEITVGRDQHVRLYYSVYPEGVYTYFNISCDDPSAMQDLGASSYTDVFEEEHRYRLIMMKKNGTYILTVTDNKEFSYEILVTVVDPPTSMTVAHSDYCIAIGETVDLGLSIEGGILWGSPYDDPINGIFSSDHRSFTGVKSGIQTYHLRLGNYIMDSFTILVVDKSENVKITSDYDKGAMGYYLPFTVTDSSGEAVITRVEITEGNDCATIFRNGSVCFLNPIQPGIVTLAAYGTDGSSDTLTIRIYPAPESFSAELPSTTISAGEKMQISVMMPEGYWFPPGFNLYDQTPSDSGITGPVVSVSNDGLLTGLMPGTCRLDVTVGSLKQSFNIYVTDSADSLVVTYPVNGFPWTEPFQLSVNTKDGRYVPTSFMCNNNNISIDENGIITASRPNAAGTITATTETGFQYKFRVVSVDIPAWLEPEDDQISLPLNIRTELCKITSNVALDPDKDLIVCSGDESILTVNGTYLIPMKVGTTVVTVWSRYSDVYCEIPVTVTKPTDKLYVNGNTNAIMTVARYTYTPLPVVTDYYGNPISVKWSITQEDKGSGNPNSHCVQIQNNEKIKCLWGDGYAEITAVSKTGSSFKLMVYPYVRAEKCSFTPAETWIAAGEIAPLQLKWADGGNGAKLEAGDVKFILTGDTDCIEMEEQTYYLTLTGLKPGTVNITAQLYNGYTATAIVHVGTAKECENGHDPIWIVTKEPSKTLHGIREQRCTRCNVILNSEDIPCTGVLSFSDTDFYIFMDDGENCEWLGTTLDCDKKNSFTWTSSDPEIAIVSANKVTGLKPGIAYITVTKGECIPAVCCVHVLEHSELKLPTGLQTIEDEAFAGSMSKYVTLPQGIVSVGSMAFAHCTCLKEILIPSTVEHIASDAFEDCPQLTIRCNAGSYADEYAKMHGIPTVY